MGLKEFFNSKKPIKLGNPLAPMGDFPLINAEDVIVGYDDTEKTEIRLSDKLDSIGNGVTPKLQVVNDNELQVSYDNGLTWADLGTLPPGEPGITPKLQVVNDNELQVSYDNGDTWESLCDLPEGTQATDIGERLSILEKWKETHSIAVEEDRTRLDATLSNYDERVGFIERYLLDIEPDIPDNPEEPDTPEEPTIPQLSQPVIELYEDDIVEPEEPDTPEEPTIDQLPQPVIELYEDVIEEPEEPDDPEEPDTPEEPTIPQLSQPVIELYEDDIVEPEEPDTPEEPTIDQLPQPEIELYENVVEEPDIPDNPEEPDIPEEPTIPQLSQPIVHLISGDTYAIEPNERYLLPAENEGSTRTFVLWSKIKVVSDTGAASYFEGTHTYNTTNIENKDYIISVSDMNTDDEGDCYFILSIDGLVSRNVYMDIPSHSICELVEVEVLGVGDCRLIDADSYESTIEQLPKPEIDLYENIA